MRLGFEMLAVVLIVSACASPAVEEQRSVVMESPQVQDVVTSLEVKVIRDSVQLVLHATNPTSSPVTLEFSTAQRYDFVVTDANGREVWRWSADRMFAQALGREVLAAGATRQYREVWVGARPGRYTALGRVTASGRQLETQLEFEVGK
jgi:hypothetical protein